MWASVHTLCKEHKVLIECFLDHATIVMALNKVASICRGIYIYSFLILSAVFFSYFVSIELNEISTKFTADHSASDACTEIPCTVVLTTPKLSALKPYNCS